ASAPPPASPQTTRPWALCSITQPRGRLASSNSTSVYAGARGFGSPISVPHSTSVGVAGGPGPESEKDTMKYLNDHLASYLERARRLEADNERLESEIQEHLKKEPGRDWGHYLKTIEDPRAQIFASSVDNTCIILQIDNAHLAADDFRVKYETELAMHQSVESDTNRLQKVTDNTNVTQLQLETEIEALKEQLLFMKNHEEDTANSGLTEMDAPKSQDISKIMADIWAQYDALAWKDREELDKMEESTIVVPSQTTERSAEMTLTELRHRVLSLEIGLDSMRNLKNSLREVETCYAVQVAQ
uniref:IF rod domain-containing protein n=1 Tax=Myotis lucifugus TaxID=59463 RepID=G1QCN5_MYOLU